MCIVCKVDSSIESYSLYSMSVMGRNGVIVSWFTLVIFRLIYSVSGVKSLLLESLSFTYTANGRFKLRISQTRK